MDAPSRRADLAPLSISAAPFIASAIAPPTEAKPAAATASGFTSDRNLPLRDAVASAFFAPDWNCALSRSS